MKIIDRTLIGARNDDLSSQIQEAKYLEELVIKGLGPEDVISDVKETLNISNEDSVIVEYEAKVRDLNKLQKNLVDTNSLTKRLLDDNLISESEQEVLEVIETRLAERLVGIYGIDINDLYLEE
jgi:protein subunit release factor A